MTNFKIIQKKNIWLTVSGALFAVFLSAILVWGLKLGIDFTGGSLLEVRFSSDRPSVTRVESALSDLEVSSLTVQPAAESDLQLRFQETSEETHQAILTKLKDLAGQSENNAVEELRFESVGPSIGQELKVKSLYAIFVVLIAILIYITYVFRKVSRPVASWKYGLSAIIAMFHDAIITVGVFAVLGHFFGYEINTAFVAAILTVLGYSVHDSIVVFDRTRENLPKSELNFADTVNMSLNQTLGRSINTTLTTLLVLASIIIFGGATIRPFVLALAVGIFIGTYSSIFFASPLLVVWEEWGKSRNS